MTAPSAAAITSWLSAITRGSWRVLRLIGKTYRLGFAAWRLAPAFVAVASIAEFAQHIVEIRLGMFASLASAKALQNDPLRWDFGYAKIAGVVITILLIGRFWGVGRSWRQTVCMPPAVIGKALLAIVLLAGSTFLLASPRFTLPGAVDIIRDVAGWIVQCGLILWLCATLFDVPAVTLRRSFTDYLPSAIVMLLLFGAGMLPAQLPHRLAHHIVLGQPVAITWAIMAIDALVIGTMAALGGSALYLGCKCGLTWRGWRPTEERTP